MFGKKFNKIKKKIYTYEPAADSSETTFSNDSLFNSSE